MSNTSFGEHGHPVRRRMKTASQNNRKQRMRASQSSRQQEKWSTLFNIVPKGHMTLFIGSFDNKHGVLHIPENIYHSNEPYGRKLTSAVFSVVPAEALAHEAIRPDLATGYPIIWGRPYFEKVEGISKTTRGKRAKKLFVQRISGANIEVTIDGKPTTISICSGIKNIETRKGSTATVHNSSISNIPFDRVHYIQF